MKKIYLVRHGQTDYNNRGIVQGGGIDSDLNETGKQQALAFFQKYGHIDFDVVISSMLKRTHQTLEPFLQKNIRWEKSADINEMNWGVHEGQKATEDMKANYAKMIGEWRDGNLDARLENGESAAELYERVSRFVEQLRQREEQKILVCTHGRTMRCLMVAIKNQHIIEMENYSHSNTGLFLVQQDGLHFNVLKENDTSHLSNINL